MATLYGPLRLRIVAGQIEERGGQVLAVLNTDAIPSMLESFVTFIEDCAEFGPTDEVVETLFPKDKSKESGEAGQRPVNPTQEAATKEYEDHLTAEASREDYDALAAKINAKTRSFQIGTVQALQIIREHFNIPFGPGDVRYSSEAADERSYRRAHDEGAIEGYYYDD